MRGAPLAGLILLWLISSMVGTMNVLPAEAGPLKDIRFSSRSLAQGDLILVETLREDGEVPRLYWMKREIQMIPGEVKGAWLGIIGADLKVKPGSYSVKLRTRPSGFEGKWTLEIVSKDYGVRRLTLPKKMVDLDAQTLKRVRKESKVMKGLWSAGTPEPLWRGPFLRPIPGQVVGPFGRRSVINDQPRSPHSGVDLRGSRGTPVKAINRGKVVLTADHFFTGNTIVLDHGGGIQSMFFHLDKILVKKGQRVEKGDIIGEVGSTGRATGPHLHWGVRVHGARINPLRLTEVSLALPE